MAGYRLPARFLPPPRYRYPYRRHRRGDRDKAAGLTLGIVLAAGLGAKTVVTVTHQHQHRRPAPVIAAPVTSSSEAAFIATALADFGAPDTTANSASMAAWFTHEWPSWPPGAANNPLDSTQPAPGSYAFNSVGVQVYPGASEGARETALTITNGFYPQIAAALRAGNGLCGNPSLAGEFLTWSGNGYSGVC